MALPVSISSSLIGEQFSYHGPFISSNEDVFTFLIDTAEPTQVKAFRGVDPTSSFSESDSSNRPDIGGAQGIVSFNAAQDGDDIQICVVDSTADSYYCRFDMSAASNVGAWQNAVGTTKIQLIDAALSTLDGGTVLVRTGNSTLLSAFQFDTESDMGTGYSRVGITMKSDLTTGTWSAAFYVGSNGMGVAVHVSGPRTVYDASSGRTHVVFREDDGATPFLAHTSITSGDVATDNGDISETPAIVVAATDFFPIGHGVCFDRAGTKLARFPYIDAGGDISIVEIDDAEVASPGYTFEDGVDGANDVGVRNGSVLACLAVDGSVVHLAHSREGDDDLYTSNDADSDTWTTPASSFAGTVDHISCNVFGRDGKVYLAQIIDDAGDIKYDEDDITSLFALLSSAEFPQQNTFIGPFET